MTQSKNASSLSRDFALLSFSILFILSIVSVYVAIKTYETHTGKILSQLENETIRIDRALIVEIENASYLLESLGRQLTQMDMNNRESISRLLRSFDDNLIREDVFLWVAEDQKVVVSSNRGLLDKPVDVSDRDYMKKSLAEPWKVQIGRPIRGRVSEKWVLPLALGLSDYKGQYRGSIVVSLDINSLTKDLQQVIRKIGISFAIYSKTLAPLTEASQDDFFLHNFNAHENLAQKDFAEAPRGVVSQPALLNRDTSFVFYEKSTRYPYVIVVGYDPERSSGEINRLLLFRLAQVLALALFLVTLLLVIRSRIIDPVEGLVDVVKNVLKGEGFKPLDHTGTYEIEVLQEEIRKIDDYMREKGKLGNELVSKSDRLTLYKENMQRLNASRVTIMQAVADELARQIHDIRQYAETIKDQHFGRIENVKYIDQSKEIFRKARTVEGMVADVNTLAISALTTHFLDEHPLAVSFAIHRALRKFQEYPQFKHIEVKLRVEDDLPDIVVDHDRFNEVLVNLLAYAAQNMEYGSTVLLEAFTDKTQQGEEEFVVMGKYTNKMFTGEESGSESMQPLMLPESPDQSNITPIIRVDGLNRAFVETLVKLHDGEMEVNLSSNNVMRLYLRFPEQRIKRYK